jgi:hypothetical protein
MALLGSVFACLGAVNAEASEGAASYYLTGGFGVAVPPEPGLTVASQTPVDASTGAASELKPT